MKYFVPLLILFTAINGDSRIRRLVGDGTCTCDPIEPVVCDNGYKYKCLQCSPRGTNCGKPCTSGDNTCSQGCVVVDDVGGGYCPISTTTTAKCTRGIELDPTSAACVLNVCDDATGTQTKVKAADAKVDDYWNACPNLRNVCPDEGPDDWKTGATCECPVCSSCDSCKRMLAPCTRCNANSQDSYGNCNIGCVVSVDGDQCVNHDLIPVSVCPCADDSECPTGYCNDQKKCQYDCPCADGEFCDAGKCVVRKSCSPGCGTGQTCQNGNCENCGDIGLCDDSGQCVAQFKCLNDKQETMDPCSNNQCTAEQMCKPSGCGCDTTCETKPTCDPECTPGEMCTRLGCKTCAEIGLCDESGRCVACQTKPPPRCTSNDQCNNDEICKRDCVQCDTLAEYCINSNNQCVPKRCDSLVDLCSDNDCDDTHKCTSTGCGCDTKCEPKPNCDPQCSDNETCKTDPTTKQSGCVRVPVTTTPPPPPPPLCAVRSCSCPAGGTFCPAADGACNMDRCPTCATGSWRYDTCKDDDPPTNQGSILFTVALKVCVMDNKYTWMDICTFKKEAYQKVIRKLDAADINTCVDIEKFYVRKYRITPITDVATEIRDNGVITTDSGSTACSSTIACADGYTCMATDANCPIDATSTTLASMACAGKCVTVNGFDCSETCDNGDLNFKIYSEIELSCDDNTILQKTYEKLITYGKTLDVDIVEACLANSISGDRKCPKQGFEEVEVESATLTLTLGGTTAVPAVFNGSHAMKYSVFAVVVIVSGIFGWM